MFKVMTKEYFFSSFKIFVKIIIRLLSISIKETINIASSKKVCAYWSSGSETKNNFGDALNPIIIEWITGKKVIHSEKIINFRDVPTYVFVGSILDNLKVKNLIVCGAGFKKNEAITLIKPSLVLAVRGPLSREIFKKNGVECPEVYCDPALFLSDLYPKTNNKNKWDVGIIPHYVDKERMIKIRVKAANYSYTVIDINENYKLISDQICNCKYILSSSLHGIIAAHSYGVPAAWLRFSDNNIIEYFKFNDYFLSVGASGIMPYKVYKTMDLMKGVKMATWYDHTRNKAEFLKQIRKFF